ncbi:dynein axonemal heavy chain 1-like [Physella acuta]|uniref:dynein axonemal heavy chain 1-like n=1 Tax=Physella acuta TaxID=109671 RepID=UPI0027DC9B38|nr:dynein axonemal heavy chain 1-like [Physella acuta]
MSYSRARFMAADKKRSTLINKLKYGETKYPQTKARGYYSDLITQGADLGELELITKSGAKTYQDSLWKINTEKHTPLTNTFEVTKEQVDKDLETQVFGPHTGVFIKKAKPGESCASGCDFNALAFEPKVQLPVLHVPGEKPRKVEVERLRRLYARLDLPTLLRERGVKTELLMPKQHTNLNIILMMNPNDPAPFPPYLPLGLFDNAEFDNRTPKEWMRLGYMSKGQAPIPSVCLLPTKDEDGDKDPTDPSIEYDWYDAGVLDYDADTKKYFVQRVDENCRIVDPNGEMVINGSIDPVTGKRNIYPNQFWIERWRLMFRAEDPRIFADRVAFAYQARKQCEAELRYTLYVDCMPMDGLGNLTEKNFAEIEKRAHSTPGLSKFKKLREATTKIEEEITLDYCRVMNQFILEKAVRDDPSTFAFVTLPIRYERPAPMYSKCPDVPPYPYARQSDSFAYSSIYTITESIEAMCLVRTECNQLLNNMSFFNFKITKMFKVQEFENLQDQAITMMSNYLREQWLNLLKTHIRKSFMGVRKGWFNIYEDNWAIYQISKMKKFNETVKFIMQDTIRTLVFDSLRNFTSMILDACYATMDVRPHYRWGNNLQHSPFVPRKAPIFILDLILDEKVHFNADPEGFADIMENLFNNAVFGTWNIPVLEKFIMQDISWSETPLLEAVDKNETEIRELRHTLRDAVTSSMIPLLAYAKKFEQFLPIVNLDIKQFITAIEEEDKTTKEMDKEAQKHLRERETILKILPYSIAIGPYLVNVEGVRDQLSTKRLELASSILSLIAKKLRKMADELIIEFRDMLSRITDVPACIEELFNLREWIGEVPLKLDKIRENMAVVLSQYDILDDYNYSLSDEDFLTKILMISWPLKIEQMCEKKLEALEEDEDRYFRQLESDTITLNERLDTNQIVVAAMAEHSEMDKAHEYANEMRRMYKNLRDCQDLAQLYNSREKLFKLKPTNYSRIGKIMKEFEPFRKLWITTSEWVRWHESWLTDPMSSINAEELERTVTESWKTMQKSVRYFSNIPAVQEVANNIKSNIEDFKPYVPLIQGLTNPGLRKRHWDILSEDIGMKLKPSPNLTFTKVLELKLDEHIEVITRVSEVAAKEYAIELSLNKMEADWENIEFDVQPYKNTGTFMLKTSDEISQMLDDHIVLTQSMAFSPFKKEFEERIGIWEQKLKLTQDVLDAWLNVQRSWLYLEPIFSSDDITKQLPTESKRYNTMERVWRKVMRMAKAEPHVIQICPDENMLTDLKKCSELLDHVSKGLSDYLETKRGRFPRFFFLSDDELLEILSQSKDPRAVQPHLRKCFENIASLKFEDNLRISKMYSGEGECVDFCEELFPIGNIEDWMQEIERVMRDTVRAVIMAALPDYLEIARTDFVLKWPGQVVIAVCQTYWSSEVTKALEAKNLAKYFARLLEQLDALRELVRKDISNIGRMTLSALIVIEVHSRDVVDKMVQENVSDPNAFEWISQLRYYWLEDENLYQRAVNAQFPYGYEYLGNTPRLVITPLTDRCYLTLTGALHLLFGGAPAGPAGTGKTETTKDLGKAFAIQCVVFNCSDQLDFMAMGKFFKGLASSGAWACFDEFNRIDIEVLSVVAQQIATIQNAQKMKMETFLFEGVEIALKMSCAVFITMNPGYAGRTELPDNLKALFRPVAMMVPDYGLISEISLFSFGFSNARSLAQKIVSTFKLSSEQLSSQDHYDFGMRAVKSVISAAGNLKRTYPDMDEQVICLRAIQDVNVPKFLADDLKLFNGIVSDLFPSVKMEPIDYGILDMALRSNCLKNGLKDVDEFIHKCIQLYETTVVRHGLMLVGPAGGGKTECYKNLQAAQTELKGQPNPSLSFFCATHTYALNPKSITMGQLYGEFDLYTHEWTDGILSTLIRVGTAATNNDKRWYVFDGPVDAVWIENMNTVLDDNKKLCLSSGEIIKLTDHMTMMFEVADLAVASPATVSRCGMVYMGTTVLGTWPFVECWLKTIPQILKANIELLEKLFSEFLLPGLQFVKSNLTEIVPTMESGLVFSLFRIMDCFMAPLKLKPSQKISDVISEDDIPRLAELVEPWFMFALIWSLGGSCDNDGRIKFDVWLREKMDSNNSNLKFPTTGLVYDFKLDEGGILGQSEEEEESNKGVHWASWLHGRDEYHVTSEMKYSDIMVPTIDTIRSTFILNMFVVNKKRLLCVGPTGTGKTLTILDKLTRGLSEEFLPEFINFSAKTSANQTQDLIDGKLDKRRKGIFGPPIGKYSVYFIDDLNMPALDTYGAQPPIELIRQYMDFQGWYDRKAIGEFRTLADVNFIAAMGPPGGGRNPVTARLLRHFNFLAFTAMGDSSLFKIFRTILQFWISNCPSIANLCEQLVNSSISMYNTVQKQMLPTPAKSHYTFNLRDLSKVFQGILMGDHEENKTAADILRLWYHECCRVFQDRLVNDEDRLAFENLLGEKMLQDFKVKFESVVVNRPVIYGDFLNSDLDPRPYTLIRDHSQAQRHMEDFLGDFNQASNKKMELVLFMDAVSHVSRIARILRQPLGNALLLGMGGSGRQSLTRLAAHISEYDCFQIELSKNYGVHEWHEDLKKVMMKAGLREEPVVFLFSDTQIKNESFLEDLNNILNTGDVPNLYGAEENENIFKEMKPIVLEAGLQPTRTVMFSTYTKRVRSNLHTVITMSPLGEIFRSRLRQFPALVNCCTIDWFSQWPTDALKSVALRFLNDIGDLEASPEVMTGLVTMCQMIQESVSVNSIAFLEEMSRHNYVTPTSYLELLGLFSQLVSRKKGELTLASTRLKTGLDKILVTTTEVAKLQEELAVMSPELEKAVNNAVVTMEQIAKDTAVAEATKQQVQSEEQIASAKAMETEAIAADAQKDLAEALPALESALSSLKSLNKNDVTEVRALQRPPPGVKLVMEATCIMKQIQPKKVPGDKPGTKVDDYWEVGKAQLQDPQKFLDSLFQYDKDNIPAEVIKKITPYINDPNFTPQAIAKVSKACTSICQWAIAMYKYHFVAITVAPKREKLKQAMDELAATEKVLAIAKKKLFDVESGVAKLQKQYNDSMNKKKNLEDKCKLCEGRLDRADKLINSLADEKDRWGDSIKNYERLIFNVAGDVLISAAFVAYLGPFTADYRSRMVSQWSKALIENKVPSTPDSNLLNTMGDPVMIRSWQIQGLPGDNYSVENGVIVNLSRRWPLFIDPQGQANKWIKNMEIENEMEVVKQSSKDFIRTLENSIRFGKPCLMENVASELDPSLEPILLRQVFKQQGSLVIKIGDNIIPYHKDFKFYMTSKLPNPHYTPEVSTKVTLINFTLSPSGLQDQLLGIVVAEERPDLEDSKNQLIVSNAKMKSELKEIEDKILYLLSASQGSPVDDIELIETLDASKITSQEIQTKVKVAETTEKIIDETRSQYIPVALNSQILFFCVADMGKIDPMYQYSLEWFIAIFLSSIAQAERAETLADRVVNINEMFTYNLFLNVCRSLFEKHKLLFGLLMAARKEMESGHIDMMDWRWLIAGGTIVPQQLPNPDPSWISVRSWNDILTLPTLPAFGNFATDFENHLQEFKAIFDCAEPQEMPLPGAWHEKLDKFQSILVLKALRPDKVTNAMQMFVATTLGQKFIEPQTTDLAVVFKDSSTTSPLVFVLSTGTDPAGSLYAFADTMKFSKKLSSISLGQGQGPRAEAMMKYAMEKGAWVFFQNCHLAPSWMPALERLVETIDPDAVHKDFRLWLTSMPSPHFPVYILQNSSKMTVEPPKGIKANLLRSYMSFSDKFFKQCPGKVRVFKHLLFSICLFHAVVLERRKFGALGFNIPYEFTDGDLRICIDQLSMFLMEYNEIPFKVLLYTAGHINYGGRVTDDWDRRCLMNILGDFYCFEVISSSHLYSESGVYRQMGAETDLVAYLEYIKNLPINDKPEIFGLHDNANITFAQNETSLLLGYLVELQPKTAAGKGMTREEVMEATAKSILEKCPKPLNIKAVIDKYPVMYEQSMNSVLAQEVIRYNRLLAVIHQSLQDLLKALKGLVVMSQKLEEMANSLFVNTVPAMWASKAYPSLKPLAAWVVDLMDRIVFINKWVAEGIPKIYWISGFFFPQAFLTGTLQNYARKMAISIDTISFDFTVIPKESIAEAPEIGCYIEGLYVEGACWNWEHQILYESNPKELYTDMPPIWLAPAQNRKEPTKGVYFCPVYKTLTRAGTLSTTGHSTNFVFTVEIPSSKPQRHWIKRGVALMCALNF